MRQAVGMAEFKTVAAGVRAADCMVKTAPVDLIQAEVVCPGKYIILIGGELSAVKAALEAACAQQEAQLIDSFLLGNPHESLFAAIYGATVVERPQALGVLETFSCAAAIVAADTAAKTALVDLIEVRLARGMCGKSYLYITGSVAAVEAAIARARQGAGEYGMLLDCAVIPSPDDRLWQKIF